MPRFTDPLVLKENVKFRPWRPQVDRPILSQEEPCGGQNPGPQPGPTAPAGLSPPQQGVTTPRPVTSQSGSQKFKVVGWQGRFLLRPGRGIGRVPSPAPQGLLAILGFLVKLVCQSGEMVPPYPDALSCTPRSAVLLARGDPRQ